MIKLQYRNFVKEFYLDMSRTFIRSYPYTFQFEIIHANTEKKISASISWPPVFAKLVFSLIILHIIDTHNSNLLCFMFFVPSIIVPMKIRSCPNKGEFLYISACAQRHFSQKLSQ